MEMLFINVGDEVEFVGNSSYTYDKNSWGEPGDKGFVRQLNKEDLYPVLVTKEKDTPFTSAAYWNDDVLICNYEDVKKINGATN